MAKRKLPSSLPTSVLQALASNTSISGDSSSRSVVFTAGAAVALQACHDAFLQELALRLSENARRRSASTGNSSSPAKDGKKARYYVQPHHVIQVLAEEMALGDIAEQAKTLLAAQQLSTKPASSNKKKRKLDPATTADLEAQQERLLQASRAKMNQQQQQQL